MTVHEIGSPRQYIGLDADPRPTGMPAGSTFIAGDTGNTYTFDGSAWPLTSGGGGAALSQLSDVALTSPQDGDDLTYDQASGKWKNAAPSGGGGAPSGIQFADVQLTDAQIKALPTTPAIVVPAQGPGLMAVFLYAVIVCDIAVAYTAINAAAYSYFVKDPVDLFDPVSLLSPATATPALLTAVGRFVGYYNAFFPSGMQATQELAEADTPLVFTWDNNGAGDFTGGDATNTLSIRTFYSVVPLAPFGA